MASAKSNKNLTPKLRANHWRKQPENQGHESPYEVSLMLLILEAESVYKTEEILIWKYKKNRKGKV